MTKTTAEKAAATTKRAKRTATKEKKAMAEKHDAASADPYTAKKLAVQQELPVGKTVVYHGKVKWAKGKTGTIDGHETRGGVFVKIGDKRFVCSPFAFLKQQPAKAKKQATKKPVSAAAAKA